MVEKERFSQKIKEELLNKVLQQKNDNELKNFMCAFCGYCGCVNISNGTIIFIINVFNNSFIDIIIKILNNINNNLNIAVKKVINFKLNKLVIYKIQITNDVSRFLNYINYYLASKNYNRYIKIIEANVLDFLKGYFFANGSISNLSHANYHLEFTVYDTKIAQIIKQKLYLQYGIEMKVLSRKNNINNILYLKDSIIIGDFLSLIGTYNCRLIFEDTRIFRDINNSLNRIINCELANEKKVILSSKKHLEYIKILKEKNYFDSLNPKDKLIIEYREKHPYLSLSELVKILNKNNVNITKSGINHVFRKIKKIINIL